MSSKPRGMGFIDFDNISIPAYKKYKIQRVDFAGLKSILLKNLSGVGCSVYLPSRLSTFIGPIQKCGLTPCVVSPGKSVDGRLIFDLLVNAYDDNFDVAIIASGDRDYISVIHELKKLKKIVTLASFKNSISDAMRDAADNVIELDAHIAQLTKKIFNYTCSDCGKAFFMTFRIKGSTPRCPECHKKSL